MPGGRDLKNDVINTSLCALCGACLDWCPYIKNLDDNLVITFDCNVTDGRCYSVCPRTHTDWKLITEKFFSDAESTNEIGNLKKVYLVKSLEPVPGQQDGGAVSALLKTALEENFAEGLLLTTTGESIEPVSFIGQDLKDTSRAAGSKFMASTGLRKIMEASQQGIRSLLMVGRPCQIQALRKMQMKNIDQLKDMEVFSIGLFCMWSLSWDFMDYLQHEYPGAKIESMAIPRHGVEIITSEGAKSFSTDKIKEYIRPGCHYCLDMTSELADISVGAFEAENGWNTLIVRNSRGIRLLRHAVEKGLLQVEEYPADQLQFLKQASFNKKARNLYNIKELVELKAVKTPVELSHYQYLEGVNS